MNNKKIVLLSVLLGFSGVMFSQNPNRRTPMYTKALSPKEDGNWYDWDNHVFSSQKKVSTNTSAQNSSLQNPPQKLEMTRQQSSPSRRDVQWSPRPTLSNVEMDFYEDREPSVLNHLIHCCCPCLIFNFNKEKSN